MEYARYLAIRERLILLFTIITKRTYPVWVYPAHLMTTDQIRDRYEYTSEDTIPDRNVMGNPVCRNLTIQKIIDLLPNVTPDQPLSFKDSHKNVVQIYENIQEYNALWYEIYVRGANYGSISVNEIQYLERLSFYLYEEYAKIRLYLDNKAARSTYQAIEQVDDGSLLGMAGLFAINGKQQHRGLREFISYYDLLTTKVLPNFGNQMPEEVYNQASRSSDTLLRRQEAQSEFGMWG